MEKVTYLDLLAEHGVNNAHPGGSGLTRKLLRHEKISSDMTLLDIGCGTGQTSVYIATHHPCQVIAADINPKMLERARQSFTKNHLDIPLLCADATHLPFPKNSFHIVLSESVITFTDISRTLCEFYRVIKPGGKLLAIEVTALQPVTSSEMDDFKSVVGITYLPTPDEWRTLFQNVGFTSIQVLCEQGMNRVGAFSPINNRAFDEYRSIMFRLRRKIGFGVYSCQA